MPGAKIDCDESKQHYLHTGSRVCGEENNWVLNERTLKCRKNGLLEYEVGVIAVGSGLAVVLAIMLVCKVKKEYYPRNRCKGIGSVREDAQRLMMMNVKYYESNIIVDKKLIFINVFYV